MLVPSERFALARSGLRRQTAVPRGKEDTVRTRKRSPNRCSWWDEPCAVPDVTLMPVVKATVCSGNQPSSYIAVYIDCVDLTATIRLRKELL